MGNHGVSTLTLIPASAAGGQTEFIRQALPYIDSAWWLAIVPGVVLTLFLVAVNLAVEPIGRQS